MLKFKSVLYVVLGCFLAFSAHAQILDDEDDATEETPSLSALEEEDKDEALFNELFSDYPETERDITNVKTFGDALDRPAEIMRESIANSPEVMEQKYIKATPLEGDLKIGVTNGSFRISKSLNGETTCIFSVTLKSEINHDIRLMALNLSYPDRSFAFVFRGVSPNSYQEKFIRTAGDVCYELDGVPDIEVNRCNILTASEGECAARLKWTTDILPPDSEERRYFFEY